MLKESHGASPMFAEMVRRTPNANTARPKVVLRNFRRILARELSTMHALSRQRFFGRNDSPTLDAQVYHSAAGSTSSVLLHDHERGPARRGDQWPEPDPGEAYARRSLRPFEGSTFTGGKQGFLEEKQRNFARRIRLPTAFSEGGNGIAAAGAEKWAFVIQSTRKRARAVITKSRYWTRKIG